MEPETKNDCADEGQHQITALLKGNYFNINKTVLPVHVSTITGHHQKVDPILFYQYVCCSYIGSYYIIVKVLTVLDINIK